MGVDAGIATLAGGASPAVVLGVAVLLGLRHATDPDHLMAVSPLVAADDAASLASIGSRPAAAAVAALLAFALAAAASMAVLSGGLGHLLGRDAGARRLHRLAPLLGGAGLVFGLAYAAAALPLGP